MEIERLVKQDQTGKNIADTDKFFTAQEKHKFYAGYGFETFMVSQRFIDKLATLENVEQGFKFDLSMLLSALTKGILNSAGAHLTPLRLAFENDEWCLVYYHISDDHEDWFYLKDYGKTWTLFEK